MLGDIHGAFRALEQVLDRSPFRPGIDRLIHLGDVADGRPETPACVERLLNIPNSIWVQGNHDWWTQEWMAARPPLDQVNWFWYRVGGQATYEAYLRGELADIDRHHTAFFRRQRPYFEDEHQNLYVHAGYDPTRPIAEQDSYQLMWSRELWAQGAEAQGYQECFVGHTPTWPNSPVPCARANVWNLDQGACTEGRLTLLNGRTKAFVQSDVVTALYPEINGY